jgi:hypothetical protein
VIKEHISFAHEWILQSYLDSKSGWWAWRIPAAPPLPADRAQDSMAAAASLPGDREQTNTPSTMMIARSDATR